MTLPPTPSQTVGPFFHIGVDDGFIGPELVAPDRPDAVRLFGIVRDGEGEPVVDALLEIWQASPSQDGFDGFGRACTDADGRYEFLTVKPGPVDGQAPHIAVSVFARGLLKRLVTRVYFPGEAEANEADPVLSTIEDAGTRRALVAAEDDGGIRFDITLQGDRETPFFAV